MSQQPQGNMAAMGGPVGGGGTVAPQMNAGTPSGSANPMSQEHMLNKLNTAIYDYLLRIQLYDVAKQFNKHMSHSIEYRDPKQSPNQRGGQQANGVDDTMEIDNNDKGLLEKPDDLPLPKNLGGDGPFLHDWWCQFWEMFQAHRSKRPTAAPQNTQMMYLNAQRQAQQARMGLMTGVNQPQQARQGYNPMMQMNGMQPNDLKRAAMQNQRNMTPQQVQMMNAKAAQQNGQMMQGNQMERQGSQLDNMSGPRSSPGSGDAPSPKRQRVEGGMQQMNPGRPGQPGQMQQGNQVGPLSDNSPPSEPALEHARDLLRRKGIDPNNMAQQHLYNLAQQPTNMQTQSVEVYSQSIQQHMQAAMNNVNKTNSNVNKGIPPNMGPGGQGSPMAQQGMDGATGEFYAAANGGGRIPMQGQAAAAAAAAGQNTSNGNHALQDYQMQLMLLEQQNKKRLLMARQEQDSMAHPAGVGPNGNFAGGMSPQGSQRGGDPSPNPNEMGRGKSSLSGHPGVSPKADVRRGSPTPGNMMDPNGMPPQMRNQMMMGQNGQMIRPPSSHPMPNMTPEQQQMMRQQAMQMPNGQFPPGQQPGPGQMMPGQQPGQPGQGQQMGTPRQPNTNMPPPPAPQANAGGTQPSSPSQQPAPPTPSTQNKAKPGGKKETGKKGAAAKKGAANATPASESEHPPTPTPQTPITPMNPKSFSQNQPQQMPNGQPAAAAAQANAQANNQQQGQQQNVNGQQQPDPSGAMEPFGQIGEPDQFSGMNLDFSLSEGGDVLDNFDFDSFLNQDGDGGLGFDANFAFGDPIGSGIEGAN
ncbi:hypothetical protein LTR37_008544 [Vermiconidia calcicola]|uniref:Uncharacterized protein n=1 Tax=Vermiconidia calcicola TaxID=1690605 RepID=A0ACC3NBN2_9PEZI|nr:hypothetical protein LTR37_008544 [Vermiconidia calcicola]